MYIEYSRIGREGGILKIGRKDGILKNRTRRREGGREIRPCTHRIVFGTQVLGKFYSVPLRFFSEPLMLNSEPLNLKYVKNCGMSYLILQEKFCVA